MATDPNLLLASSIFGQPQANMQDPRLRALFGLPQQPVMVQKVPVPVPVPVPAGRSAAPSAAPAQQTVLPSDTSNPFAFWNAPQAGNEPNVAYGFRNAVGAPIRAVNRVVQDMAQGIREGLSTPDQRAAAAQAAQPSAGGGGGSSRSAFPTSYNDPAYDQADAYAAKLTGVPVQLLSAIRTRGERTNAGVTSVAGANTPYQITAKTRQGIIKNYGIDPWSSPENAALGAAYVLREQAGAPKTWDNPTALKAIGGYFGGAAGAANPFNPNLKDANGQSVGGYTMQVLNGKTPLPAPFLNPYDPSYDQAAMGMLGKERQALLTPFSATVNTGPAPDVPTPQALPTTDFSKSEADLQAMKPVEMSAKEQLSRQRDGFWTGIAQAMLKSPGDEGLGTFLMRLGAGAMLGRQQANSDIRAEQSKFDDKMAQWQAAVYRNDLGEANTKQQEATAQIAQNNQYNLLKWQTAYNQWTKNSNIDISGTNAVITERDPQKGTMSVRTVPIQSAVDAAIAQQGGQLFQHMGGMQMAGNQQITSMTNAIIGRQAIETMSGAGGNANEKDAAAAAAPAFYGTFIAQNGLTGDLLGPDGAKSLEDNVKKQLMGMQLIPGSKEWLDRHDRLVATEIAKLGLANPQIMQKMIQVGAPASSFQANQDLQSRTTSTTVNAKGQPSTRTSMNASDVFSSDNFNQDLADHGYTRY